jgi:hypothetical protein
MAALQIRLVTAGKMRVPQGEQLLKIERLPRIIIIRGKIASILAELLPIQPFLPFDKYS